MLKGATTKFNLTYSLLKSGRILLCSGLLLLCLTYVARAVPGAARPAVENASATAYNKALGFFESGELERSRQWLALARTNLAPSQVYTRWEISREQMPAMHVWLSTSAIYAVSTDLTKGNMALWQSAQSYPVVLATKDYRDFYKYLVDCYDLKSGRLRWRLRMQGIFTFFLSESLNRVYLLRQNLLAEVDASEGKVLREMAIPPIHDGQASLVDTLLVGRHILTHRGSYTGGPRHSPAPDDEVRAFDVDSGAVHYGRYYQFLRATSPPLRFIDVIRTRYARSGAMYSKIICRFVERDGVVNIWEVDRDEVGHAPIWFDGDVLVLDGAKQGAACRLDGQNGSLRWRYALNAAAGAAVPGLADSKQTLNALWVMDGDVAILDNRWNVHLLDAASGRLKNRISLGGPLRGRPIMVDDLVVLPLKDRIAGVPKGIFFGNAGIDAADIALLEARHALALKQVDEAAKLAARVVSKVPWKAEGWLLHGYLCEKTGRADLSTQAYLRYLDMTGSSSISLPWDQDGMPVESGQRISPLEASFGLMARIRVGGELSLPLCRIEGQVVAIDNAGVVAVIDPVSLQAKRHSFEGLPCRIGKTSVKLSLQGRGYEKELALPLEMAPQADAATLRRRQELGRRADALRNSLGSWVFLFEDREYVLRYNGDVDVIGSDGSIESHTTKLKSVKNWQACLANGKPIGKSNDGVLILDENLCPQRRVLEGHDIYAIAGSDKTLAVVTSLQDPETHDIVQKVLALVILDASTFRPVRTIVPVGFSWSSWLPPFVAFVNGGYLLGDKSLPWYSESPEVAAVSQAVRAGAVNDTAVGKVIDAENGTDWLVSRFRFPVCL
jgi:hypothetical protein